MKKKSVTVLMSTYNGEKYLEEQLESIFNQNNVDVKLIVRDDGSTDGTIDLLEKWSNSNKLSYWVGTTNLGPEWSFMDLVAQADEDEYFAFSDQDDVWFSNKLDIATDKLKQSIMTPALFISTYDVVDSNLKHMFIRNMHFKVPYSMETTLMYRCPSGCAMVFNKALMAILKKSSPDYIRMHDFWILLTAEVCNAQIILYDEPLLQYRQHDMNAVGESKGKKIQKIYSMVKKAVNSDNERLRQAESLLKAYENIMDLEQVVSLKLLTGYKTNIKSRLKLLNSANYKSANFNKNILFKISVLLGQF